MIPGIRRPAVRSSYSLESIGTSKQLQPTDFLIKQESFVDCTCLKSRQRRDFLLSGLRQFNKNKL